MSRSKTAPLPDSPTPTTARAAGRSKGNGTMSSPNQGNASGSGLTSFDWRRIAYNTLVSRALDDLEEQTNRNRAQVPKDHVVLYQFSARGHDMAQSILGSFLTSANDGVGAYYRSRPLLLSIGLSIEDALGSPLGRAGGFSDGRDIGVVCNFPNRHGPKVLPKIGRASRRERV